MPQPPSPLAPLMVGATQDLKPLLNVRPSRPQTETRQWFDDERIDAYINRHKDAINESEEGPSDTKPDVSDNAVDPFQSQMNRFAMDWQEANTRAKM